MSKWTKFNHNIQYCIDDIHSMVHDPDIKVPYTDENKISYMSEITHNMMNKFLSTIVTSDIDNKVEAKRHFLECVIQSCQGAIDYRLQEGIHDRSRST